jgi:hypothetical protein
MIVAIRRPSAETNALRTGLARSAGVVIVARDGVDRVRATELLVAGIGGAIVVVITGNGCTKTSAVEALVVIRTCVQVVTCGLVISIDATDFGIAGIVGAYVVVGTIYGRAATDTT